MKLTKIASALGLSLCLLGSPSFASAATVSNNALSNDEITPQAVHERYVSNEYRYFRAGELVTDTIFYSQNGWSGTLSLTRTSPYWIDTRNGPQLVFDAYYSGYVYCSNCTLLQSSPIEDL